jgi:hypothetical protein
MALGPGKYDDLCTYVYERAGVGAEGGVAVIVIGGTRGSGFSLHADLRTTRLLPDWLENVAKQIRESGPFLP